jgi:hypothetical protein|tara:strand:+ start:1200 stop:1466 length:267 start_codon:yes stop_codon:yes gene_type:complete
MHDQQQTDHLKPIDRTTVKVAKTSPQAFSQLQFAQQGLHNYQPRKRRKPLIFEAQLRYPIGTSLTVCFAELHYLLPPGVGMAIIVDNR